MGRCYGGQPSSAVGDEFSRHRAWAVLQKPDSCFGVFVYLKFVVSAYLGVSKPVVSNHGGSVVYCGRCSAKHSFIEEFEVPAQFYYYCYIGVFFLFPSSCYNISGKQVCSCLQIPVLSPCSSPPPQSAGWAISPRSQFCPNLAHFKSAQPFSPCTAKQALSD